MGKLIDSQFFSRLIGSLGLRELLALYFSLTVATLSLWHVFHIHDVTGDEPHYLIIAGGLIEHGSLEQTRPYEDEFRTGRLLHGLAGPPDAKARPLYGAKGILLRDANTHAVGGPHGLFNIHGIGLPLLLVIPFALGGVFGAKLFMVALSGLVPFFAWKTASLFTTDRKVLVGAVLAATIGLPLIPAATQIYPDLPGGIIALGALYWLASFERRRGRAWDLAFAIAVAFLPWLHIRFAASAVILLAAAIWFRLTRPPGRVMAAAHAGIGLLSFGLLALYNTYAFGSVLGPSSGFLMYNKTALMAFFGLNFDQNQGFLLQNPVFFIGVLWLGRLFARSWELALVCLVVFASFIVPNALCIYPYGGFSFMGRFQWAPATVFLLPTLLGLTEIGKKHKRAFFWIVTLGGALQLLFLVEYLVLRTSLMNVGPRTWFSSYSALYRPISRWLPALYNESWAAGYAPNIVFLVLSVGCLILGLASQRWNVSRHAKGAAAAAFLLVFAGGFFPPPPEELIRFPATAGAVGRPAATEGREATANSDQPGILAISPFWQMASGQYRVTLDYASKATSDRIIGKVGGNCLSRRHSSQDEPLYGTGGDARSRELIFRVSSPTPALCMFSVTWNGTEDLFVRALTLNPPSSN